MRAYEGRIDDCAVLGQLDVELVRGAWFARVRGPHREVDVTEHVCPRRATNPTGTGRLAGLGVSARCSFGEVRRDVDHVDVQVEAVVVVFEMAPERTLLAPAANAEVPFVGAVRVDEAATRQEVTLPAERRRRRRDVRDGEAAGDEHQGRNPE